MLMIYICLMIIFYVVYKEKSSTTDRQGDSHCHSNTVWSSIFEIYNHKSTYRKILSVHIVYVFQAVAANLRWKKIVTWECECVCGARTVLHHHSMVWERASESEVKTMYVYAGVAPSYLVGFCRWIFYYRRMPR